jgi:hypothetical protein
MSARALAPAQKQSAPAAPLAGRILQRQCDCGNHSAAGGECGECKKKKTLQRASSRGTTHGQTGAIPPIVGEVIGSAGQPLRADIREQMERHFAHDFSGVRVHSDRQARLSAEAVQARAYTVGQHVVFGEGFAAGPMDERLMSHELAHVVQQSRGGGTPGIDGDPALEADANRAASDVVLGRPAQVHGASAAGLAREEKPANEVFYEVNFPDGKKRLSAAEFEAQKQQILGRMRSDLRLVSDLAENGRQSQTDMLKEYQGGVESLSDVIAKPKALIGIAADIWGHTTPPYIGAWSHPKNTAAAGLAAADRGDLREAANLLSRANREYRDAMHEWNSYREKTIGGAESLKSDLELVRDVSFGIALAAGAVVAAPVVAGVVATAGVTGVAATALTAGGTALVVGAGGAALGGGSTAAASYAVEGKVDWKETKKQAAKFGKQGAVTGLTAGLGNAVGAAGKAAELGKPLVQQALRRCVTEAGVNLAGEVTTEALDRLVPTESPEQKAEAESKAVIDPKARSILVGCVSGALGVPTSKLRSGTAKVADVAVGAGVSYADAKLQGQTNEQALLAAAQSAGTSHLAGMGKKGSDAAKASKESAKAPSAAAIDEHLTGTAKEGEKPPTPPAEADTAAPAHDEAAAKPHDEAAGKPHDDAHAKPHDEADAEPPEKADTDQGHRRDDQPEPPGPATSIDKESGKAKKKTAGDHEVVVTEAGIGVCSPSPCPVIHEEYKNELKANPELQKAYEEVQALRKKDPEKAAGLADALVRKLEEVRSSAPKEPGAEAAPNKVPGVADLDARIAAAEAELNPARQKVLDYQASRKAEGKSLKGGDIKGIWNIKERIWLLKRQKAYPGRTILEQVKIVGVRGADGSLKPTTDIAAQGRTPDFVEMHGDKAVAGDLKSASELQKSIAGGLKKPGPIEGDFRASSKVGGQHQVEGKVLAEAQTQNGKIVMTGTNVMTGKVETIEVDVANYSSEVLPYEEVRPN